MPRGVTELNARNSGLSDGETFEGWWPTWAKRQAFTEKSEVIVNERSFEVEKWEPTSRSIRISGGTVQDVSNSTYYYPHWKANINGDPVDIVHDAMGRISFQIPPDEVRIDLTFSEPRTVVIAALISFLGWLGLLPILFWRHLSEPETL